jgi:mono/diheme cytochrome c family protein
MRKTRLAAALFFMASGAWGQTAAKDTYLNKCAMCHGPDGAAKTMMGRKLKIADIRAVVDKRSADQMITVVQNGKGTAMSAYGKDFNKEQIKALVEYFRGLAKQ